MSKSWERYLQIWLLIDTVLLGYASYKPLLNPNQIIEYYTNSPCHTSIFCDFIELVVQSYGACLLFLASMTLQAAFTKSIKTKNLIVRSMLLLNVVSIIFIFYSLRKDCTPWRKVEFDLYQTIVCGLIYTVFTLFPVKKIKKKEKEL